MLIPQISTEKENVHMSNEQEVKINVDGVKVLGEIFYRTEADIAIRITRPYKGLSNGCHIPYFSRPFHSFLNDYGDKMAENLLKYLYELGKYMDENRKFIEMQFSLHLHGDEYLSGNSQDRFFGSTFPFVVPIDTRDDVLEVLK
jgi:hypothetical protein